MKVSFVNPGTNYKEIQEKYPNEKILISDVGSKFSPEEGLFDHHTKLEEEQSATGLVHDYIKDYKETPDRIIIHKSPDLDCLSSYVLIKDNYNGNNIDVNIKKSLKEYLNSVDLGYTQKNKFNLNFIYNLSKDKILRKRKKEYSIKETDLKIHSEYLESGELILKEIFDYVSKIGINEENKNENIFENESLLSEIFEEEYNFYLKEEIIYKEEIKSLKSEELNINIKDLNGLKKNVKVMVLNNKRKSYLLSNNLLSNSLYQEKDFQEHIILNYRTIKEDGEEIVEFYRSFTRKENNYNLKDIDKFLNNRARLKRMKINYHEEEDIHRENSTLLDPHFIVHEDKLIGSPRNCKLNLEEIKKSLEHFSLNIDNIDKYDFEEKNNPNSTLFKSYNDYYIKNEEDKIREEKEILKVSFSKKIEIIKENQKMPEEKKENIIEIKIKSMDEMLFKLDHKLDSIKEIFRIDYTNDLEVS